MHVEDFEPDTIITSILSSRGSFLKMIGAKVKDVFGMGKEKMPTNTS